MVKIPETPVGPTVALPQSGSGVLQKASDFADPNVGKELIPKQMIEAIKADQERQNALQVIDVHNSFADRERQMLDKVRQRQGKDALGSEDKPAVYDQAMEWYDKEAQTTLEALPSDRQKELMSKMLASNRDKGLDAVSLHQAQQNKVYAESVSTGAVQAAKQGVGMKWGDVAGVEAEFTKAATAINAAHPGEDNTQRLILAQQDIYGHAVNLALAYGDKDDFAYAKELLFGQKGKDGAQLTEGIRDKISPDMQAHAVTTLRVQGKNTANMNTYFGVMADAGNNPAKAVALLNDPGYVASKGLAGDTWRNVMALAEGRAHYQQGQADRARTMQNEAASKNLVNFWIQNKGDVSPEAWMQFAKQNPAAAGHVIPFMQNSMKAQGEAQAAQADYAMFQASLNGTLTSQGWQLLAQNAPALSSSRRDHWSKVVSEGLDMKPAYDAFKQSAAMAGLVFDEKAGSDEKKQKNNGEYVRTLRAYEDEVRKNPTMSAADMQKVADKYTAPVVTGRTTWNSGPGFLSGLLGTSGDKTTFGSARYGGGLAQFTGDKADLKPTVKQMSKLGMIPSEEAALKYYESLGKDSLIIRQGAITIMDELNAGRTNKYPVNERTIGRIERDALAKYGPDYLFKKGQAAWLAQ